MSEETELLGRCPECDEPISGGWGLVRYEKADGVEGVWAECPGCGDVVAPQ